MDDVTRGGGGRPPLNRKWGGGGGRRRGEKNSKTQPTQSLSLPTPCPLTHIYNYSRADGLGLPCVGSVTVPTRQGLGVFNLISFLNVKKTQSFKPARINVLIHLTF